MMFSENSTKSVTRPRFSRELTVKLLAHACTSEPLTIPNLYIRLLYVRETQ
jgi:hypothetical protein